MVPSGWKMEVDQLFRESTADHDALKLNLVEGIQRGNIKLCDIIEHLQDKITSSEKEDRLKALGVIVDIFTQFPKNVLNSQEASLLCDFLCLRLLDHYTLLHHTLQGLLYICKWTQLESAKFPVILSSLFNNVHNQSQRQEDRHLLYTCVYACITLHTNDLKAMDNELVHGFIQAMEGEKDPRNLVAIFQIIPIITRHYKIAPFAEELFQVIACYFPITFKSVNKDGQAITEEDLVIGLRRCLASTADFADFCLPLLVEKLTSSLPSAKLDSLLTLEACTEKYPVTTVDKYFPDLWECIKREVFESVNEDISKAAIAAVSAILKSDYVSVQSQTRNTAKVHLEMILNDLIPNLNEPNHKLMSPSAKLLHTLAKSSNPACMEISNKMLPILLHNSNRDGRARIQTTQILIEFLKETQTMFQYNEESNPVLNYKTALAALFYESTLSHDPDVSFQGLRGQEIVTMIKHLLNEGQLLSVAEAILNIAMNTTDTKLKEQSLKTLSVFVTNHQQLGGDYVIRKQLDLLQSQSSNCERILQTLVAVSLEKSQAQSILTAIFQFITRFLQDSDATDKVTWALMAMAEICKRVNLQDNKSEFIHDNVVIPLLKLTRELLNVSKDVADLYRTTVPYLNPREGSQVLVELAESFLQSIDEPQHCVFSQLQILEGVLSAVSTTTPIPQTINLTTRVLKICLQATEDFTSEISCRCLCSIVNKVPNDQSLWSLLDHISAELNSTSQLTLNKSFTVWVWVTKGLLMRGYDQLEDYIYKITNFLQQDLEPGCVQKFRILADDIPELVTTNSQIFYKQRLFLVAYPRLVQDVEPSKKLNHVAALATLVDSLPLQAIQPELSNIVPTIIRGLSFNDATMVETLIRTLGSLIETMPTIFTKHLEQFIKHCLRLATEANSMNTRISALRCLAKVSSSLSIAELLPHRGNVINGLLSCLDDNKRLVRKQATKARTNWYLVGSPGGL